MWSSINGRWPGGMSHNDGWTGDHKEEQQDDCQQESETADERHAGNRGKHPCIADPSANGCSERVGKLVRIHGLTENADRTAVDESFGKSIEHSLRIGHHPFEFAHQRRNSEQANDAAQP